MTKYRLFWKKDGNNEPDILIVPTHFSRVQAEAAIKRFAGLSEEYPALPTTVHPVYNAGEVEANDIERVLDAVGFWTASGDREVVLAHELTGGVPCLS